MRAPPVSSFRTDADVKRALFANMLTRNVIRSQMLAHEWEETPVHMGSLINLEACLKTDAMGEDDVEEVRFIFIFIFTYIYIVIYSYI